MHVQRQEEPLVKLIIGILFLSSEGQGVGQEQDFFSIVKRSQRREVGNLICKHGSNWARVARFASTGDIVCLDFDTHV